MQRKIDRVKKIEQDIYISKKKSHHLSKSFFLAFIDNPKTIPHS